MRVSRPAQSFACNQTSPGEPFLFLACTHTEVGSGSFITGLGNQREAGVATTKQFQDRRVTLLSPSPFTALEHLVSKTGEQLHWAFWPRGGLGLLYREIGQKSQVTAAGTVY